MIKRRKAMLVLAAAVVLLVLFLLFLQSQNKVIYGVSEGTYAVSEEDIFSPYITFDLHKNRFTLVCDPLSSYLNTGTIELDGKITATTDDGKYTYIFEVVDNDTIRFVQKGSSDIASRLEGDPLADGTEFKFCDRR